MTCLRNHSRLQSVETSVCKANFVMHHLPNGLQSPLFLKCWVA